METPSLGSHPRWLLPRAALVELAFALTRLAIVGLFAIGVSGVVAGIFGAVFGRSFVAGDPPGVSYTAARCADFAEYAPGATTCEQAATWHHYGEVVQYRLGAGLLGLLLLAACSIARRRLRGDPAALPPGFEATVGTVMYGAAACYLLGTSVDAAVLHEAAGVGEMLSGGLIAAVMTLAYGIVLYRLLLSRARPTPAP
jgi:hypothetical protein